MREDKQVEAMLSDYAQAMPFAHRETVWRNVAAGRTTARHPSRRMTVAVVCCVLLILSGTVFAEQIGQIIARVQFVGGDGQQYDVLMSHDGVALTAQIRYASTGNPEDVGDIEKSVWLDVTSIDEAQAAIGLDFPLPSALPDGYQFERATLLRYDTGIYSRTVDLQYRDPREFNRSLTAQLFHVGNSRATDYSTVNAIGSIQINGQEGIIVRGDEHSNNEFVWQFDEWLIVLGGYLDDAALLEVAESFSY